jgi:hypothetical protein
MNKEILFPRPTGSYAIGTKLFELTDPSRMDPETHKPREFVVQIWYPAAGKLGLTTAPYAYETREICKQGLVKQGVSTEKLHLIDGLKTYAIPDASVCGDHAPYPVVIFGHGFGATRGGYSLLCEELASHGYVVMMAVHTHGSRLVRFADGHEVTSLFETSMSAVFEDCFADVQLMLNQVIAGAFGHLTPACDFKIIGMVGHSLGGVMTAQMCRRDARVKAGISLDGALWGIDATKPFHKPFLFLRTPTFYKDMIQFLDSRQEPFNSVGITRDNFTGSIERFCRENGSDTRQIIVQGASHKTFCDDPLIQELFEKCTTNVTPRCEVPRVLPVPLMLEVIRGCMLAFFDTYVKSKPTPSSCGDGARPEPRSGC